MPQWILDLSAKAFDQGLAIGLVIVAFMVAIAGLVSTFHFMGRAARFLAPQILKVVQGHRQFLESTTENATAQTSLMSRQTAMLNDIIPRVGAIGFTLDAHGRLLDSHGQQLLTIARRVGAEPVAMPPTGPTTIVPALEVAADHSVRAVGIIQPEKTG